MSWIERCCKYNPFTTGTFSISWLKAVDPGYLASPHGGSMAALLVSMVQQAEFLNENEPQDWWTSSRRNWRECFRNSFNFCDIITGMVMFCYSPIQNSSREERLRRKYCIFIHCRKLNFHTSIHLFVLPF